ncbi:hypothetical protein BFJ69_g15825 [Fusarium oxysporum]|uniref:Tyrosinase copper-binding domain-containing protein n=1 Tax=Fusarium oxysporum TaxID=5507 RepID=A0A420MD28_FUSOX|nr:hypothetical protein BFJ69_g15825 [Fusarium oxysporum]
MREKVQRFMTRTTGHAEAEPTPMDWIYEARTYGMHIRFNTPTAGSIDWVGEQITYRKVRFTMTDLSEMLHALKDEARRSMATLAMVSDTNHLPRIPWSKVEDDHAEDRMGYSFLDDDRNTEWTQHGKSWIMHKVGRSRDLRCAWIDPSKANPFRAKAVQEYGQEVEQFRERLFMLMHMVAGQPARAPEILGIRFRNTMNGGIRNVFAHRGMMCFVTSYHKGFRSTGQVKVIHRYLPREIGELLVWYLWLVLPFWQRVQRTAKGGGESSPFLWSDEVVRRIEEGPVERRERERAEKEHTSRDISKGGKRHQKKGALPTLFHKNTVKVREPKDVEGMPRSPKSVSNPLSRYQLMVDGKPKRMGDLEAPYTIVDAVDKNKEGEVEEVLPWSQCFGTSRYGIKRANIKEPLPIPDHMAQGINNYAAVSQAIDEHSWYVGEVDEGKRLQNSQVCDLVHRLLTAVPEYNNFSSTLIRKHNGEKPWEQWVNLEYVHNNLHNWIGGSNGKLDGEGLGHMSNVPVAAFDPIFYMHHW